MGSLKLKEEVLNEIKGNPDLFANVANCLKLSPAYLLRLIRERDLKLTQASVLRILAKYFELDESALLTEVEPTGATA